MAEQNKVKSEKKLNRVFKKLRLIEKWLFRVLFPYKLHGNLKKYNNGRLLVIGNHYSALDVIYSCRVTDRPVRFVAKKEVWKNAFLKWFAINCQCIPANRDGTDVQTVKTCLRVLQDGGIVSIFPEGTRNHSYSEFLPFHSGAAALSIRTQTPIIPVVTITKPAFLRRTHVVIGDPIEFRQYYGKKVSKEELDACDGKLREALWNMRLAFIERHKLKIKDKKR